MPMPRREPLEKVCPVCQEPFLCGGRGRPKVTQTVCSDRCQRLSRFRRGTQAADLDPLVAAYLAGIVDGEGSIMLITRRSTAVHLRLAIANTDRPLLDWVAEVTGVGNVYVQREATATHKASFSWRCHGDGAESLIQQMRPHLRIKGTQADLGLELHAALRDPARKADRVWQQQMRGRIQALNRRGS